MHYEVTRCKTKPYNLLLEIDEGAADVISNALIAYGWTQIDKLKDSGELIRWLADFSEAIDAKLSDSDDDE